MKLRHLVTMMLVLPAPLFAHVLNPAGGFSAGLLHPLTGIDHLLFIVLMGMLGVSESGKLNKGILLSFAGVFSLGILIGYVGKGSAFLSEILVVLSLFSIGGYAVWAAGRSRSGSILLLIVLFGFFHGHLHGYETAGSAVYYLVGVAGGTLLALAAGVLLSLSARKFGYRRLAYNVGGSVALMVGIGLLMVGI